MTKEQIFKKLTSRKMWAAIAGFVSGVIIATNGDENTAQVVAGLILQGASVIAYIFGEGLTDMASLTSQDKNIVLSGIGGIEVVEEVTEDE